MFLDVMECCWIFFLTFLDIFGSFQMFSDILNIQKMIGVELELFYFHPITYVHTYSRYLSSYLIFCLFVP